MVPARVSPLLLPGCLGRSDLRREDTLGAPLLAPVVIHGLSVGSFRDAG